MGILIVSTGSFYHKSTSHETFTGSSIKSKQYNNLAKTINMFLAAT
jgi:hypothetical protein